MDDENIEEGLLRERSGDEAVVVTSLYELARLSSDANPPERVEFRAPADADYGTVEKASLFVRQINDLKADLSQKGYHCRISSEVVKENVWLFRYLPSKKFLANRARKAELAEEKNNKRKSIQKHQDYLLGAERVGNREILVNFLEENAPLAVVKFVDSGEVMEINTPLDIKGRTVVIVKWLREADEAEMRELLGNVVEFTAAPRAYSHLDRPLSLWERFTAWLNRWT